MAAASESLQGRKPRRGKGMAAGRKPGVPFSEEEHHFCWPLCGLLVRLLGLLIGLLLAALLAALSGLLVRLLGLLSTRI